MRLSKLTWTALALTAVGVLVLGGWVIWVETRIIRPIYLEVSMAPKHVRTPEFRVNLKALYTIVIEAKKTVPYDLNCLLGMSWEPNKCGQQSVVKASWVLSSRGQTVAQGSSDDEKGGFEATDTVARQIGSFRSERGRRYVLDVDFNTDGRVLAPTHPHLKVEVHPDFYEASGLISYFLFWPCVGLAGVGLLLLAASGIRAWRNA